MLRELQLFDPVVPVHRVVFGVHEPVTASSTLLVLVRAHIHVFLGFGPTTAMPKTKRNSALFLKQKEKENNNKKQKQTNGEKSHCIFYNGQDRLYRKISKRKAALCWRQRS
jgi:hypothetical protein